MTKLELFSKDPIYVEKYESKHSFRLIEAKEDWLCFRSEVSIHAFEQNGKVIPPASTTDLIVVGAMYVELVNRFNGIEVSRCHDEVSLDLAKRFDKGFEYLSSDERVFMISSESNSFRVVASNIWIHEHCSRMSESPFPHVNSGDVIPLNKYLKENVATWIKIK